MKKKFPNFTTRLNFLGTFFKNIFSNLTTFLLGNGVRIPKSKKKWNISQIAYQSLHSTYLIILGLINQLIIEYSFL